MSPHLAPALRSLVLGASLPALLLLTAAGCGGSNAPMSEAEFTDTTLLEVGDMLRMYQIETGEPPKSFNDLLQVTNLDMAAPMGFEKVRNGDFVVRWGATLPDTSEEIGTTPDKEVLAYSKEVPDEGGTVLLLNRTITTMTPDEFAAAPKAGNDPD